MLYIDVWCVPHSCPDEGSLNKKHCQHNFVVSVFLHQKEL